MFSHLITYALLLTVPYTVSAAPGPKALEARAITGITTSSKYGKTPTPAFHIPYGKCYGLNTKFSYTTGAQFYTNVLKPGVWLAGDAFAGCGGPGTICGQCFQAQDTSGNALNIRFLMVDHECSLVTAPGALTALQGLTSNFNGGMLGRPLSECIVNCNPTPDLWGCL
ncbi:hypothetical protein TWF281_003133 [Arthrobotrys megalospora]